MATKTQMLSKVKKAILILFFIISCTLGKSQLLSTYSQYTENIFLINPSVAGNEDRAILSLANRLQWTGSNESPKTQSLSGQWRLKRIKIFKAVGTGNKKSSTKKGSVGLGVNLMNEKHVFLYRTGFQFAYAYHIDLKGETRLSFGLALTAFQSRIDQSLVRARDPNDQVLLNAKPAYLMDANAGVYLLGRNYFVGVSSLQLMQSILNFGSPTFDKYQMLRHYYVTGGYHFEINRDYVITPSALIAGVNNGIQMDLTCRVNYQQRVWGGLSYRTNNDIIALFGVNYEKLYITYAMGYSTSPMGQKTYGTHELTISMKMHKIRKSKRVK